MQSKGYRKHISRKIVAADPDLPSMLLCSTSEVLGYFAAFPVSDHF